MTLLNILLKNRHPEPGHLAWDRQALAGPETLHLRSPDVPTKGTIPLAYAARRADGQNVSPALTWTGVPAGTAQLLFLIEDPDAPTRTPWVHCVALLDPGAERGEHVAGGPCAARHARVWLPGTGRHPGP